MYPLFQNIIVTIQQSWHNSLNLFFAILKTSGMEQTKNNESDRQTQNNVEKKERPEQGRVAGSNQQTDAEGTADISQVDQQEGQMNNGELGGNFDKAGPVKGA